MASKRIIEGYAIPRRDSDGKASGYVAVTRDITEKKQVEEARKLNRTLKALGDSRLAMMRAEDETSFLKDVCRIVVEDCGHAMAWIGFAEEDADKSVRPVAHAGYEAGYLETLAPHLGRYRTGTRSHRNGDPDGETEPEPPYPHRSTDGTLAG